MKLTLTLAPLAFAALMSVGCKSTTSPRKEAIHDVRGEVVSVNKSDRQVTVDLEDAQGKAAGERVVFSVADVELLTGLGPGDKIEGKCRNDPGMRTLIGLRVAVAVDVEYFCPMHPRVVRNLEIKCPICWMPLSKRKKDPEAEDAEVETTIQKMPEDDRALVKVQRFCPVLNHVRLAIDGPPVKLTLDGKTLFLCCEGCIPMAKAEPAKTLKQFELLLRQAAEASSPVPVDQRIASVLSKLTAEDRQRAAAQRLCPVTGVALGSMGMPEKVKLGGEEIFLCCPGCKKEATIDPEKTLKMVRDLRTASPKK